MDKTILMIFVPLWWAYVVTPDLRMILENTNPAANVVTLGLVLIAAKVSELHRTKRLPSLRRGEEAEYAVEFEDESEVWEDD